MKTSREDGMINLDIISGSGINSGMGSMFSSYGVYLMVRQYCNFLQVIYKLRMLQSSGTSLVYEVDPSVDITTITVPIIEVLTIYILV